MRDDEPDLYGGMGGQRSDDDRWEDRNVRMEYVEVPKFYTGNQVSEIKKELKESKDLLQLIYDQAEQLPYGVSQKIREVLTK
jgi:hypothetical protein